MSMLQDSYEVPRFGATCPLNKHNNVGTKGILSITRNYSNLISQQQQWLLSANPLTLFPRGNQWKAMLLAKLKLIIKKLTCTGYFSSNQLKCSRMICDTLCTAWARILDSRCLQCFLILSSMSFHHVKGRQLQGHNADPDIPVPKKEDYF